MKPIERDAAYLWDMLDSAKTMPNVLAHEYDDVKQERMWLVATVHVLALIPQLEAVLPPPPSSEE